MTTYTITSVYNMSIRDGHTTVAQKVGSLGKPATGTELWVETQDTTFSRVGDKWLKIATGWVAIIHMGKVYCSVTESQETPPPTDGIKRIIKAVVTYETDSGAIMTQELK